MKELNIGVIGGSGFIGSHLVDKLVDAGHEVTVFDIKTPHRRDVDHVFVDITNEVSTTNALRGGFDQIYHLAAVADVNDVYNQPVASTMINTQGVVNVLEAVRRNDIERLIFASTIWVYGAVVESEVDEYSTLSPKKVDHVYVASKIAGEMYCQSYQKLYGQDFTILRYGIPYGPRARSGTVIEAFTKRALAGEPLTIHGDGNQYRYFIYVEDLAEGNVCALKDIAKNKIYNLDGMRKVTVNEVAETIRKIIGDVEIKHTDNRAGDYGGKQVSIKKAKKELGWEPKVDFEEGTRRYINWYKEYERL